MMDIPELRPQAFADMQTVMELGHKQRMYTILEAASAMALKLKLEGKMSTPQWDEMEKAIASLEQAGTATIALVGQVITQKIDPATIIKGAQRVKAVADAMAAVVAEHTVAASPNNGQT